MLDSWLGEAPTLRGLPSSELSSDDVVFEASEAAPTPEHELLDCSLGMHRRLPLTQTKADFRLQGSMDREAKEGSLHETREDGGGNGGVEDTGVHRHVVGYRRMIAAFNQNDLREVESLVSPDIVYTLPGRSSLAGVTRGVPAHLAMLRRARQLSRDTLRFTPEALAVDGDHLFVWGSIVADIGSCALNAHHCVVYRFADDKIVEGRTIPTDQYAFDDFWTAAEAVEH